MANYLTLRTRSLLPFALGTALLGCNSCNKQERVTSPRPTITNTTAAIATASSTATPLPSLEILRSKCFDISGTIITSLRQLGCLTAGTKTAKEKINEARAAYLQLYGLNLEKGTIILKKPDDFAVSEGMGFGGAIFGVSGGLGAGGLALSGGDSKANQAAYWQLYQARKAYFLMPNGVMAWKVDKQGKQLSTDSASDGDQDWIASELFVLNNIQCGRWKLPPDLTLESFRAQIQKDLNAFWNNHIKEKDGRLIYLPTNGNWAKRGDGRDIYYTNYADPYFLKLFAKFDPSHAWAKLADDVQELNQAVLKNHKKLGAAGQNPIPAKVFTQVASDGSFIVENYYEISKREGVTGDALVDNEADSIRFLLRIGRAAILGGDQTAKDILKQLLSAANITDPTSAHIYAGAKDAPSPFGWNNTLARASYGIAVLGIGDKARAEKFFCTVMTDHKGQYFGEWDGAKDYYYDQSMILQILDLAFASTS